MNRKSIMVSTIRIVSYLIVASLPLFHEDGLLWVLAVVCARSIYYDARAPVVYTMGALLLAVEIIYGMPVGVTTVSYLLVIVLYRIARRFITVPAWSAQDGWRIFDALRTVIVAVLLSAVTVVISVVVADVLYHSGYVVERMRTLWNMNQLLTVFVLSLLTCCAVRRVAVPFRREILFGT